MSIAEKIKKVAKAVVDEITGDDSAEALSKRIQSCQKCLTTPQTLQFWAIWLKESL
jgi:hypothetical protein